MAIAGYAFFLSGLDVYYYLSLMPSAVLMVALALTAPPSPRIVRAVAIALTVGAIVIVPARWQHAMTLDQMPEYGAIVHASRVLVGRGMPIRAIRTEFKLPPTNDPEYIYGILGGQIDRASPWIATIQLTGDVTYRKVDGL
jgi:hypothetical protein